MFGLAATAHCALLVQLAGPYLLNAKDAAIRNLVSALAAVIGASSFAALGLGAAASLTFGWSFSQTSSQWLMTNLGAAAIFLPTALLISHRRIAKLRKPTALLNLMFWIGTCVAVTTVSLSSGSFPFAYSMIPLLIAAVRLPMFQLAIVCMVAGISAMITAATGNVVNLPGSQTLTIGFQVAVAINIVMPVFGSVLLAQIRYDARVVAETEERFRRAVHDSQTGMLTLDFKGRIVEANPAFARMLGYNRSHIDGSFVQELTAPEDLHLGNAEIAALQSGEKDVCQFQIRYLHRDGSPFWVEIYGSVIRSQLSGAAQYIVAQVHDIDARKKAERELAEMEARWDFALASAGQGFWDHNVNTDNVTYSTTWTSLLGYEKGELNGDGESWLGMIHRDDLPDVQRMSEQHQAGKIPYFEYEYRMRHKAGHWVWVLDRGKVVERAEDGSVRRMIGTLTDISQRKHAENDLARTAELLASEKERLRVTLNSIGDAVICTDANQVITFMNPVAEAMTGTPAGMGVRRALTEIYLPVSEDPQEDAEGTAKLDEKLAWHNLVIACADGGLRSIREVRTPIVDSSGKPSGQVIVFQDVTDLREKQRELAHAATHDTLTGLANRSSFLRKLSNLVASNTPGDDDQLLYIDLDRFKNVNDTSGHAAGDRLLRLIADSISATVRSVDLVARLGGDEFGVVLRACPPAYARIVAQKIVETIAAIELEWNGTVHGVGASIGLASISGQGRTVEEIIERADQACYAAKAAGRGCVWEAELDADNVIGLPMKPRSAAS